MNTLVRWDPLSGTRWNPFKDREEWERRVASMLGTLAATGNGWKEALTVVQWSPLVDITEDEKEYLITSSPIDHVIA
jgi:HSP20 family protein